VRDEIMFVFRIDENLNLGFSVLKIDRDLDRGDSFEKRQQLIRSFYNMITSQIAHVAVPARHFNLHERISW